MIREPRSREKLESYYTRFLDDGQIDLNVHPWVAESWKRSQEYHADTEKISTEHRLDKAEFAELQKLNSPVIKYLEKVTYEIR